MPRMNPSGPAGKADIPITGDGDLLALREQTPFEIETQAQYRARFPAPP